jgi:hypothetical protein
LFKINARLRSNVEARASIRPELWSSASTCSGLTPAVAERHQASWAGEIFSAILVGYLVCALHRPAPPTMPHRSAYGRGMARP